MRRKFFEGRKHVGGPIKKSRWVIEGGEKVEDAGDAH